MYASETFHYPQSVVCEIHFLDMIFDAHLTWVPHLRLLHLAYQSPHDFPCHLSHTTWSADMTTLLCLSLVLVHSELDYGAHVYYCTVSPCAFTFWTLSKMRVCA